MIYTEYKHNLYIKINPEIIYASKLIATGRSRDLKIFTERTFIGGCIM